MERIIGSFLSVPEVTIKNKTLRIGLIGCGTVGSGLIELLRIQTDSKFEIARVGVKNLDKDRGVLKDKLTTNCLSIIDDPEIDVVVELTDSAKASLKFAKHSLSIGKPFVTANKRMVADNLNELHRLAHETGTEVYYEAAVAGSIPIIATLSDHYRGQPIESISAILNGSSNYVLTLMDTGRFNREEATSKAQELGFAETDPSLDLEGKDAAYKLSILIRHAYGMDIPADVIPTIGIDRITLSEINLAHNYDLRIKQIARASFSDGQLRARVAPELVTATDPLYHIADEQNGIVVSNSQSFGDHLFSGNGAGGKPTALSVLADLELVSRGKSYQVSPLVSSPGIISGVGSELVQVVIPIDLVNKIDTNLLDRISYGTNLSESDHIQFQTDFESSRLLGQYDLTPVIYPTDRPLLSQPIAVPSSKTRSLP